MKHNYMLGLAMTGLLSLPSYVQVSAHQFPTPFNAAKAFAAPVWAPKTPSLAPSAIDDKSKGITMYAGERMDQSKKRSFIKFKSKDVQNFQQIQYYQFEDKVGEQLYGLTCGASDGKNYYGFYIVVTVDASLIPAGKEKTFTFPIIIEGVDARPSDRTPNIKVNYTK